MACYDDRYILKLASENDGIIVSNDNYRDLVNEKPEFKKVVDERLLMYTFANDRFMPPDDPLGRKGPSLDNFLRMKPKAPEVLPPACPYGKKCTYGNKCKYYHPERGNQPQKSVTERLVEQAKIQLQEVKNRQVRQDASGHHNPSVEKMKACHTTSLPPSLHVSDYSSKQQSSSQLQNSLRKTPLSRTKSVATQQQLSSIGASGPQNQATSFDYSWRQSYNQHQPHHSLQQHNPHGQNPLYSPHIHNTPPHHHMPSITGVGSCTRFSSDLCLDHLTATSELSGDNHSFVTKRLSDPEKPTGGSSSDSLPFFNAITGYSDVQCSPPEHHNLQSSTPGGNLHRKLARQLTLNPTSDPRLNQIYIHQHQTTPSLHHQQMRDEHEGHTSSTSVAFGSNSRLQPIGSHRNASSNSKLGMGDSTSPQPPVSGDNLQQLYTPFSGYHQNVSRISSAPDPHLNWSSSPGTNTGQMVGSRLNSSSDSRLHLTPSPDSTCSTSSNIRTPGAVAPFPGLNSIWSPSGPSIFGNNWSQSAIGSPAGTTGGSSASSSANGIRSSSVPTKDLLLGPRNSYPLASVSPVGVSCSRNSNLSCSGTSAGDSSPVGSACGSASGGPSLFTPPKFDSERDKLYYHLSSIFPEDQVRTVMEMNPEESNPQRVCAAILSMYPKG